MPRHAFSYSADFTNQIRNALTEAIEALDEFRFPQEPKFTSALLGKLHGLEIQSNNGEHIKIETTDVADRGKNSAEYRSGADFVITATCSDGSKTVRKAILFQLKEGNLRGMSPSARKELENQINKMKCVVNAPKIGGIIREYGKAKIMIASANRFLEGDDFQLQDFPVYFNQRVITTLDGNTDQSTVNKLQNGNLPAIKATIKQG
ncbi:MAG: hypothetical protein ACOYMS_12285 [Terrimicrobiaceae bacterium]